MKPNYTELDAGILAMITAGQTSFAQLRAKLEEQTSLTATWAGLSTPPPWRVIDRRLQALRKAGKIRYTAATGWQKVS